MARTARTPAPKAAAPVMTDAEAVALLTKAVEARDTQIAVLSEKLAQVEAFHRYDPKQPMAEAERLYDLSIGIHQQERPVMAALASLAAYFHDEGSVWSEEARNWVPGNVLAKQQQFFLKDFCYKLTDKLHYSEAQLDKARLTWKRVCRETIEDEIGLQERARVLAWGQKVREEFDRIQALLQQAEVLYEHVTGDRFVRQEPRAPKAAPRPQTQAQHTAADLEAQAKALGFASPASVQAPYTPTHDGIDAAH